MNHEKYNGETSYLCLLMPKQSTSFTAFTVSVLYVYCEGMRVINVSID